MLKDLSIHDDMRIKEHPLLCLGPVGSIVFALTLQNAWYIIPSKHSVKRFSLFLGEMTHIGLIDGKERKNGP